MNNLYWLLTAPLVWVIAKIIAKQFFYKSSLDASRVGYEVVGVIVVWGSLIGYSVGLMLSTR